MTLATITGLLGQSLLIVAITLKALLLLRKKDLKTAYTITALIFILTWIPIEGYSINLYLRGILSDLSITTVLLLLLFLAQPKQTDRDYSALFIFIALAGIILYPLALGYSILDPYAWGYLNQSHGLLTPMLFIMALALIAGYAYIKQQPILLSVILLSVIAFQLGILESRNIWDYLLDPLLWLYALFQLPFIFLRGKWHKA